MDLTHHDDRLTLTVENDGLGFSPAPAHDGGMGLKIMHHRAEVINGSLDVRRGTDGGTIVTCAFSNRGHT
jgi:signal transduction histidine kinase